MKSDKNDKNDFMEDFKKKEQPCAIQEQDVMALGLITFKV